MEVEVVAVVELEEAAAQSIGGSSIHVTASTAEMDQANTTCNV
jgi:hypothetical protein